MHPLFRVGNCIGTSSQAHSRTWSAFRRRSKASLSHEYMPQKFQGNIVSTIVRRKYQQTENARKLRQRGQDAQKNALDKQIHNAIELQARTPWHRESSSIPPAKRIRRASAMTKATADKKADLKSIEPLALLVHPQQPLSYLDRLIQSELPMITGKDGKQKVPQVWFKAEDNEVDEVISGKRDEDDEGDEGSRKDESDITNEGSEEQVVDGKVVKLGKIKSKNLKGNENQQDRKQKIEANLRGGPGKGGVESYSAQGREGLSRPIKKFVRWSSSTEIADFIRDAARGSEFAVEIEGALTEIRVGVPSFNDRTHYLRIRLRKISGKLADLAGVKKECDHLAHRSAQRLALGGFALLVSWWGAIYHFTFQTDYGWDTMEPITYLAGLSTIMLGYLWFLYHNREVSYRAALNLTVSKRQDTLYQARGFDMQAWESLIEEANALRKEIKAIANEYDVEWDERKDEASDEVHQALKMERSRQISNDDEDSGFEGNKTKQNEVRRGGDRGRIGTD